jgi:hypothetical protein
MRSAAGMATATCSYLGGVELVGVEGISAVVATAAFPVHLHVTGLSEDPVFRRENDVGIPLEV